MAAVSAVEPLGVHGPATECSSRTPELWHAHGQAARDRLTHTDSLRPSQYGKDDTVPLGRGSG